MGSYGHINCCRGGCADYNHVVGVLEDCWCKIEPIFPHMYAITPIHESITAPFTSCPIRPQSKYHYYLHL